MQQLLELVDALLRELSAQAIARESLEWYLQNNLEAFKRQVLGSTTPRDLENATRALRRFCTESMEWDSELFRTCTKITTLATRLSKAD